MLEAGILALPVMAANGRINQWYPKLPVFLRIQEETVRDTTKLSLRLNIGAKPRKGELSPGKPTALL